MAYFEYFDQRAQDLNAEITNHPLLMGQLERHEDPTVKLAHVAAYCQVALDGAYTEEECNVLCDILTKKLIQKRTQLILPLH
jgi:hypothetical protein